MALPKYYDAGTISVANGATSVTGTGTAWLNIVKADDRLTVEGYSVRIASVASNTSLTLAEPWPGTTLSGDDYEIAITYDGPEFQLRVRELLESLTAITTDTTLAVPTVYADINAAIAALDGVRIASDVYVTIDVADGTHNWPAFVVNHPDSSRILIRGNVGDPSLCILEYDGPSITAFYVGAGQSLDLDGFTIQHATGAGASRVASAANWANTIGLIADEGGYIKSGANMTVDGFFWNLFSRRGGSVIRAEAGGVYTRGGDANALAYEGGHIDVAGCTLTDADDPASTLGSGAVAEGGTLDLTGATLTGNSRAGLHLIDGYVRADGTDFSSNTGPGILHVGGVLELATGCTAGGNGTYGYDRLDDSMGTVSGLSTLTAGGAGANTTALYKPHLLPYYASQPGMRVVSPNTDESARWDSKGSGYHFFNTGGGLQFAVAHVASAVNYVQASGGAAGSQVTVGAQGSDTNINLYLESKGSGSVRSRSRGLVCFEAFSDTSAVNWLGTRSVATGTGPSVEALGGDTNIDVRVVPKGSGGVRLESNGSSAARFVNSSSSSVNYVQIGGSATGTEVSVAAGGSDTNVGLSVNAKGTGSVRLRSQGLIALEAFSDTSAVNWLGSRSVATGSGPSMEALGGDTNIDLRLVPKGSGNVRFGTWTSNGDAAVNGYVTIKDAAGNTRKLATIA